MGRTLLTAPLTLFVDVSCTNGDSLNDGLSNSTPFQTINHAAKVFMNTYDLGGYWFGIQCADGIYPENVRFGSYVGRGWMGHTSPVLLGNPSNRSAVKIAPPSGVGVTAVETGAQEWLLQNLTIEAPSQDVVADLKSVVSMNNCSLGGSGILMQAENQSMIELVGPIEIHGGGSYAMCCGTQSQFIGQGQTITLTGTPAFIAFAASFDNSYMNAAGMHFSGAASSGTQRCQAARGGGISTSGFGEGLFPGGVVGSIVAPGWIS